MNSMVPVVKALIILDGDGNRLSSKYYAKKEFPTDVEQVRANLFIYTPEISHRYFCHGDLIFFCSGPNKEYRKRSSMHNLRSFYPLSFYLTPRLFWSLDTQTAFETTLYRKTKHTNARQEAEIIMLEKNVAIFRASSETRFYVVGSNTENELILTAVLDGLYEALNTLLRGQTDRRTVLDSLELVILTIDEIVDGGMILETDPNSIVSRVLMRGVDGGQVPLTELTIGQALTSAREQLIKSMGNREPGSL